MSNAVSIDVDWRRDHALPRLSGGGDKGSRGRVLLVGGSTLAPGALRLSCEAALRVGAGKVRIATVETVALPLGMTVPEAGVVALPQDDRGEIAEGAGALLAENVEQAQVLAFGSGMRTSQQTPALVRSLLAAVGAEAVALLDSAALIALAALESDAHRLNGRLVLTPHPGELAALLDADEDAILADMEGHASRTAERFNAVVALKSAWTVIASPGGSVLRYANDAYGLGTAGAGDVLVGVIGGLLARGADPLVATAWGVWLHGEAGQAAARSYGPLGFLARDLLPELPRIMATQAQL